MSATSSTSSSQSAPNRHNLPPSPDHPSPRLPNRSSLLLRWLAILSLLLATTLGVAWYLGGNTANEQLITEVAELESLALRYCGFDRTFDLTRPVDQFFLQSAKRNYAVLTTLRSRHDLDPLTLARGDLRMGMIYLSVGQTEPAILALQQAWDVLANFRAFPPLHDSQDMPDAEELSADNAAYLAVALAQTKRYRDAAPLFDFAIQRYQSLARRKPDQSRFPLNLAGTYASKADSLLAQKQWSAAAETYSSACQAYRPVVQSPDHPLILESCLAHIYSRRAAAYECAKNHPAAIQDLQAAISIQQKLLELPDSAPQAQAALTKTRHRLSTLANSH